jgi:hypothetical protein
MVVEFINENRDRVVAFDRMVNEISLVTGVEKHTIRTYGERALNAYGNKRFNHLYSMTTYEKRDEKQQLAKYLERYFHAVVPTEEKVEKAMKITKESLDSIFKTV